MDEKELALWRKAGKITAEVREYARTVVKPGVSLLEATRKIEAKIYELGARPAFPVTIGLNHIAAHYAADFNDTIIFKDEVVKVDIGAQIDGYMGDTAVTIDLSGKYGKLLEASEKALEEAIKVAKAGVEISKIGRVIQDTIESYGFSPIHNLSGHGLVRYDAHTNPSIPNYDTGSGEKLKKGSIIAIEPFATDGKGFIKESNRATIFSQVADKPIRDMTSRKILAEIRNYKELPFSYTWLSPKFSEAQIKFSIKQLMMAGILRDYPPLPEVNNGIVSQFEHTLYIGDETEVLTR